MGKWGGWKGIGVEGSVGNREGKRMKWEWRGRKE